MGNPKTLYDNALEQEYIYGAILDPNTLDKYPILPTDLEDPECSRILSLMLGMRERGEDLDYVSLITAAHKAGTQFDAERFIGSRNGLGFVTASTHRRLQELATARRIRAALVSALASCESLRLDETAATISDATELISRKTEVKSETSYQSALRIFEQMAANKPPKLVPTGITKLDAAIGGLGPGSLTFLGADTGVGKSSTMLFMADAMERAGHRPGLVTCEDGPDVLGTRIISLYSGVSGLKIRRGEYREIADDVVNAMEKIRLSKIQIAYEIGSTDAEVVRAMSSLVKDSGSDVLFVDYIQTLNASEKAQDRRNELRRMCSRLKQAAARLGVPLIVGSQLSMGDVSDGRVKVPNKHMLKESRDLANMADFIILLWRESSEDSSAVLGKLEKSKVGMDHIRFKMCRDSSGTLREIDERY